MPGRLSGLDQTAVQRWPFDVPSEAEDVTATIVNEAGDVVRTFRGLPTTPDEWHAIAWDGRTDGGAAAAGESFTLKIAALDGEGEEIAANTYVTGRVDSVILDAEAPILGLDSGDYITSEHIIEVTGGGCLRACLALRFGFGPAERWVVSFAGAKVKRPPVDGRPAWYLWRPDPGNCVDVTRSCAIRGLRP